MQWGALGATPARPLASQPELPTAAASSYVSLSEEERPAEAGEILGTQHINLHTKCTQHPNS